MVMTDPRFFSNVGPFSLAEIADSCEARFDGPNRQILDIISLDKAEARHLSFLESASHRDAARATKAGAVFVKESDVLLLPEGCVAMICAHPHRSYALAAHKFYPNERRPQPYGTGPNNVHKTAIIHPSAVLGANVSIGAGSVIEPNVTIAQGVQIGENCYICANVTISHSIIGNRVRVFPGTRIGQPGFGYAIHARGEHLYVPQLGRVIIEDDVEIGSNCAIDRGAGPDTKIGAHTKIDNLVQIAHNVQIGRSCLITGQVGIAGSTKLGNGVFIGGQAGITGHISIADGVQIAAQTGVLQAIDTPHAVMGTPAIPLKEFMRREAWLRRAIRAKRDA